MNKILTLCAFVLSTLICQAQSDIQDARENFNLGDVVTVTGIVTNDGGLGSIRYIQDESAGVAIYPGNTWDGLIEPQLGDNITVTGPLTEFNGLLEVGPGITEVIINSSGNPLPAPLVVTPNQIGESLEGMLIQMDNAQFETGGVNIQGNTTYDFSAAGENGIVYFRSTNTLVGTILPAGSLTLVGIVSQFTFDGTGGYQVLPRNGEDFVLSSSINLASEVEQDNITTTSFDLSWSTDAAGNSIVDYGLTPALGTTIALEDLTTSHTVELSGLEPGQVYFAQVKSELGEDETSSNTLAFATKSLSSGAITTYFTSAVDNDVATEENAISLGADMNDTIIAYIDRAMISLDIAVYNCNNTPIIGAVNDALDRGVQVRYITEASNLNIALATLSSDVPVLERTDGEGSGMHNKFVIIDADDVDNAHVLTGSTNWTDPNLSLDWNNLIIFQDQSLARGYRVEFEEMWGSNAALPDISNAKFGPDKTKNTPVKYIVGESPVEVYFSPTDNTTSAIANALLTSEYDLDFATLSFTRDDLRDAVIDVNSSFFITARGVIEVADETSEYDELLAAGVDVYSHTGIQYQVHHKMAIVDHSEPLADPLVITGSHNWSSSAENINDENTVIVHDARVANLYFQEWWALYSTYLGINEAAQEIRWMVGPNPTRDFVQVSVSGMEQEKGQIFLFDINGKMLQSMTLDGSDRYTIDLSSLPKGMYQLSLQSKHASASKSIVVQ